VSGIDTGFVELNRRDRLSRWVFWSLWSTIVLIAAAFYYEKANDNASAFVRWRPQVLQFAQGVNIYEKMLFPTPPLMPITLYPLMVLPTITGAMCWFAIKVAMTSAALVLCFDFVRPRDGLLPPMFRSLVLLLSLRPILGDLHHGNNNLLILFLIVAMLAAWREGYDVGAGLLLALATTYKVTPALFFLYFAYKRSWRTVGWGLLGLGIFLLIVPSAIIGPTFNGECLGMWWNRMVMPFVREGATSPQEANQSVVGVISRLLTSPIHGQGPYAVDLDVNFVSLPPAAVGLMIKVVTAALLGLLALFCRTRATDRRDPRLLGEFALVVLTMLFVSERSWKHHYVTVLLPITYLASEYFSARVGPRGRAAIVTAWVFTFSLMAMTSSEIGGFFHEGKGHKIAQGYGMFMWAGVVLYATVAWRVWCRRKEAPDAGGDAPRPGPSRPALAAMSGPGAARGLSAAPIRPASR
jgi:alpha-1,2-mannosyltransferase